MEKKSHRIPPPSPHTHVHRCFAFSAFLCMCFYMLPRMMYSRPSYPKFHFTQFQLPVVNLGLKNINWKIPEMNNS